jgi:hypothetical protein
MPIRIWDELKRVFMLKLMAGIALFLLIVTLLAGLPAIWYSFQQPYTVENAEVLNKRPAKGEPITTEFQIEIDRVCRATLNWYDIREEDHSVVWRTPEFLAGSRPAGKHKIKNDIDIPENKMEPGRCYSIYTKIVNDCGPTRGGLFVIDYPKQDDPPEKAERMRFCVAH